MAYIGQSIKNGTFTDLSFSGTFNSSNTAFSLGTQVGSPAQLLVSKNGVIQRPGTDYTLSSGGASITFTTAPASGDSIFIVEISGAVGGPLGSDLNGSELILDADGDTSLHASTDDQIDIKIAGADDFKFSANAMNVLSGSTLTVDSGATITNSGTATGFGKINQVVSVSKTDTFTTTSTSLTALTGLTANITPTASNSKILVSVNLGAVDASGNIITLFQLLRGTTVIGLGDASGSKSRVMFKRIVPSSNDAAAQSAQFLDSPSSTSQLTYSIKCKTSEGTLYINRSSDEGDSAAYGRTISTITLMEVLA